MKFWKIIKQIVFSFQEMHVVPWLIKYFSPQKFTFKILAEYDIAQYLNLSNNTILFYVYTIIKNECYYFQLIAKLCFLARYDLYEISFSEQTVKLCHGKMPTNLYNWKKI